MLVGWKNFVEEVDPDVVIGYNIAGFDLPYLLDRAKALRVDSKFAFLGRLKGCIRKYSSCCSSKTDCIPALIRRQDANERHAFLLKSLRSARHKGNCNGRADPAGRAAIHAARAKTA